jgi:hydroxymethylpyrimidine pyrophosphatase-like HAD family hydrolase
VPKTREVADVIAPSNDEHGVAYAIEKYVLQK